ncbi:HET-domain-containing protein [Plenodomus tracheiphilus IPT5]|uniref:HET-domain-containing protein n=1 Tax=Plenodomus tracheiphilus IPT5 TaxID=1408161 RepID=A0A6A7AWD9_9PLEO|nr:HET-domain-containing protein [Plenodomus tracheiphilus IPT5]
MRLLHSTSLEFEVFYDEKIPPYLILSHTWEDDELQNLPFEPRSDPAIVVALAVASGLNYHPTLVDTIQARIGYSKILRSAEIARQKKLDYFWIDTCCIDKSSSAELQEAINSMHRWYQNSNICIVYLEDMPSGTPTNAKLSDGLTGSKWITRGWTLQELIAPSMVTFYDQRWAYRGKKHDILYNLSLLTGIPGDILRTGNISRASVAQKMSWAASRVTTRIEDRAYSLLGIFGVHMPMLYGEGDRAFRRLQEEIVRTTPDDSVFAWTASEGSLSHCCGLLANSPSDFRDSRFVEGGRGDFSISNLGVRIETQCGIDGSSELGQEQGRIYNCMLQATKGHERIILKLRHLLSDQFTRVQADSSIRWDEQPYPVRTLYIEHEPQIPKTLWSSQMTCFHLIRRERDKQVPMYRIKRVWPGDSWDLRHHELRLLVWLKRERASPQTSHLFDVMLLLGYDKQTHRVWCSTAYPGHSSFHFIHPTAEGSAVGMMLRSFGSFDHCPAHARFDPPHLAGTELTVEINSGLSRGRLAHVVEIDGLEYGT